MRFLRRVLTSLGGHQVDVTVCGEMGGRQLEALALIGLGIPESEAQHYETEFEAGHILVTVKASAGRYAEAIAIMNRAGATSHKFA